MDESAIVRRSMQSPGGAFHPEEAAKLCKLLLELPKGAVTMEVGVSWGRSASVFLQVGRWRDFEMYFVDNWSFDPPGIEPAHYKDIGLEERADYRYFQSMIDEFEVRDRTIVIHDESVEASKRFGDETFDLIHIDADHMEESIWADCEHWMPKLKRGGVACFHDYGHSQFPGIAKAIAHFCDGWREITQAQTLAVRVKP